MSRDVRFSPQETATIERVSAEINKRHTRALWKTRVAVSFLTSLVISCSLSIGVSSVLIENSRHNALVNAQVNCRNIEKLKSVGIDSNTRAADLIKTYINTHKMLTPDQRKGINIQIRYYDRVSKQYKKISCETLR